MDVRQITISPTIEKTFLGMLAQTGEATSLHVKNAMRTLDPNGYYVQADVSNAMREFAEEHYINHSVGNKGGVFFNVYYVTDLSEAERLFEELFEDQKSLPQKFTIASTNYTTTTTFDITKEVYWLCGTYNGLQDDVVRAVDKNSARAKWAAANKEQYKDTYARRVTN